MDKINPIKHVSTKVARIKEDKLPAKPINIEEATINLLNFFVKSKRNLTLKGKAHKIKDVNTKEIKKVTNLFKAPPKK